MFHIFVLSFLFLAALWSPAGNWRFIDFLVYKVSLCFVNFPCDVSDQIWYLIASITDFVLFTFMSGKHDKHSLV